VHSLDVTPSSASPQIKPHNEPEAREHHTAVITVTDTGPGLSRDQLALICSEGVQFNPNELQAGGGSGLGLWISQQIIDLHGGTMLVSSPGLGLGATFEIKLPLLRIETLRQTINEERTLDPNHSLGQLPSCPSFLSPVSQHPKKILIVDDTPSNRKMLGRILKSNDIPFDEAEDGEVCLTMVATATAASAPYDLILMDYEMPILNGPKATQRLRESGCRVIIIGVTGNVLQEDKDYFIQHGADAVLPKPVKIQVLLELFEKLAKERESA
jgi:two-component system, sensor histidine kinase